MKETEIDLKKVDRSKKSLWMWMCWKKFLNKIIEAVEGGNFDSKFFVKNISEFK